MNVGATIEEIRAVRAVVISTCEASGLKTLDAEVTVTAGWGWRVPVASI